METPYGSYTLPMHDVTEYIELVENPQAIQLVLKQLDNGVNREKYLRSVDIEILKDSSSFWIIASANTPEDAYQRAAACIDGYLEITDVVHGRMITEYFYHTAGIDRRNWQPRFWPIRTDQE